MKILVEDKLNEALSADFVWKPKDDTKVLEDFLNLHEIGGMGLDIRDMAGQVKSCGVFTSVYLGGEKTSQLVYNSNRNEFEIKVSQSGTGFILPIKNLTVFTAHAIQDGKLLKSITFEAKQLEINMYF